MNSEKLSELFLTGAFLSCAEGKLYHPSFRKGWTKLSPSSISFLAATRNLEKTQNFVTLLLITH